MARMIYPKDSTAMHLRMGRRHIRLCGRIPGAEKFTAAMQQVLDKLKEQEKARKAQVDAHEDAYDDVILCDANLDNAIRIVFERTRQWDRDHMGRVLEMLFPNHTYSDIVRMPLSEEPLEAGKLIVKLESLGEEHELHGLVDPLREKTNASKAAWDALQLINTRLKEAQAAEELAKLAVRQCYEHNYLDARKEFGAAIADSIFPKINSRPPAQQSGEDPGEA